MENGQLHDDKLFRAVHDRLSDYEAPANGADWDAMSRSLDSMPKNNRFQWKISLNTILVALGVVGISVLGFTFAHSGNAATASTQSAPEKQQVVPVKTNLSVNNTTMPTAIPVTENVSSVTENTQAPAASAFDGNFSSTNSDGTVKRKRNNTQFRFGDQIDPKKGFIYNTKENSNVITQPVVDPDPNIFYDSENGKVKRIEIDKKDSTGTKGSSKRKPSADSTANNTTKPAAPVDGGRQGFDMEGN